MSQSIADRIKLVLEEQDLGQAELAEAAGVDPSTAWRWVEGERTPQRKNLQNIAKAFGYNYAWLAKGKGEKRSVEGEVIPPNAAIVFYDAETKEIWATAELAFRVRIHKPIKIIGGKTGGGMRIDVDTE